MLNRGLHRLVRVYTCQNAILLEITCYDSFFFDRVGLTFDVAVEELHVTGTLQIVLQMSMDVPFPHVTKASFSFTDV